MTIYVAQFMIRSLAHKYLSTSNFVNRMIFILSIWKLISFLFFTKPIDQLFDSCSKILLF